MSTNGYPFLSRKQIVARLSEPAFVVECVAILQDRYARRATVPGESMGWMASHASRATALAEKLASGGASEKERAEAAKLASSYSKQLARVFRDRELAARPELAGQAAMFGVTGTAASPTTAPETSPVASPSPSDTVLAPETPAPHRKRGGRPKGSKNKPKPPNEPARRKRG